MSICQSFLCLDLCAVMVTMTTLAENVSNLSRQTSPKTVKQNGASLLQEVSFPVGGRQRACHPPRQCRRSPRDAAFSATSIFRRKQNSKGTQREVHRQQQKPALHTARSAPSPAKTSLAHTTAVTKRRALPLILRPCLQGWTDRVCGQHTLPW